MRFTLLDTDGAVAPLAAHRDFKRPGLALPAGGESRRGWLRANALLCVVWVSGSAQAAAAPKPATVLVFGDSLSAEYGLAPGQGCVALTEAILQAQRWPVKVINASLSGETTAGGLTRLPALLQQHHPSHVVIELGGNDALRGLPVKVAQEQLQKMVKTAQQAGAKVVLVGMMAPPNMGRRYGDAFAEIGRAHV